MDLKQCKQCNEIKPINDFYPIKRGDYTRFNSYCKKCHNLLCKQNYNYNCGKV